MLEESTHLMGDLTSYLFFFYQ